MRRLLFVMCLAALTAACGSEEDEEVAKVQPTLASIQKNVFDKSCSSSSCHGSAKQGGLELRDGAEGPLVFARWLIQHLSGQATLEPIHVIEQDQVGLLASADKREQVLGLAEDAVARTLERSGDPTPLGNLRFMRWARPTTCRPRRARTPMG